MITEFILFYEKERQKCPQVEKLKNSHFFILGKVCYFYQFFKKR